MPVLGLISGMQAGLGPLSLCHSGVPALQRSHSRHIPFVSAWRSLFTFHWLDIPIRAADYLLTASSSSASTGHSAVSHLFLFLSPSLHLVIPISLFFPVCLFTVYLLAPPLLSTFTMAESCGHRFTCREVNSEQLESCFNRLLDYLCTI